MPALRPPTAPALPPALPLISAEPALRRAARLPGMRPSHRWVALRWPARRWPAPALLRLLALLVLLLPTFAAPALAQTFPPLTGRVVDAAGLIDPATEAELTRQLAAFEQRSSDQFVVATVPDLQGYEIADYGYRLGRAWGIGRQGENNGVILLVSKADRRVRIEVGYGLEGTLTDALSRLVIENDILPRFRANDYPGGIRAGTEAILQILGGNAAEVEARAERNKGWQSEGGGEDWLSLAVILFILFVAVGPLLAALLSRLFGGGRGGPGSGPGGGSAMPVRRRRRAIPISPGWGGGFGGGLGGGSGWGGGGSSSGGGFSGGGGSFGGGGSSGSW